MNKTVGLCLIVKDEINDVVRIVKNYGKFFDKVFVTATREGIMKELNELPTLIEGVDLKVSYFEWCNDFAKARNFNFGQADTDYIFWIDADDDIANPAGIKPLIETYPGCDLFYMNYQYAFDESGNCIMQHIRERLIRNNKCLYWKGRVHETLVPVEDVILQKGECTDIQIIHRATFDDVVDSHKRNIEILVNEYNEHKEKTDPRTISYLANELSALRRFDEAIKFYQKHIQLSGWSEDKYLSWINIAQNLISLYQDNPDKKLLETAIDALTEAMIMFPEFPDSYLGIGECYFYLNDWEKAIEWTNMGITKPIPTKLPFHNPTRYTIRPLPILAWSYLNLGEIEKAYGLICRAKELAPKEGFIVNNFPFFEEAYNTTKVFKNYVNIAKYLEENDRTKLEALVNTIPNNLSGDDRFIRLRNRYSKPAIWGEKSVVIYCGYTGEEWAAPNVIKGIGGSEEAVIYFSKELTKLGYNVTVFNNCGDMEGEYDGVSYKNYWHFNTHDLFNVIISWRQNIFTGVEINGRRKLVWLHDVPLKNDWNDIDLSTFDKVIVLSNYHRSLLQNIPDDKIYVSTNGINVEDFVKTDDKHIERLPKRIIYASSYNRGLEHLLDMWPEIKNEVPEAELHICYGWQTFDIFHRNNQDQMRWKEQVVQKMRQPGIVEHGRLGHKKLLEEYAKSSVWAYPTFFPEINCITALKAQAMGCIPVYHNQFALTDTVHYGYGIKPVANEATMLHNFKKSLINALNGDTPAFVNEMKENIRNGYSWESVAKEWSESLFETPVTTEV